MDITLGGSLLALSRGSGTTTAVVDGSEQPAPVDDSADPPATPPANPATLSELIAAANSHLSAAEEAQRQGDWARYGQELEALRATLDQLTEQADLSE
jgi:uncharacterized membrane protein (UPF0182 family)